MKTYSRRGDLAGPVLLIGFGVLVLLINLGRIPVSLWGALSQLWPLALIILGLDLLIPRRSILASVLVAALLLGVVLAGAALALPGLTGAPSAAGGEEVSVPSSGESSARVSLISGAGTMMVDAASGGDDLLAGSVSVTGGQEVGQTVDVEGDTTTVTVKTTGTAVIPVAFGNGEVWEIAIAAEPALELSTQMGAGEIEIDATRLNLTSLDAGLGAGEIRVRLPEDSAAKLSAAVGELTVTVPQGASVRLRPSHLAGTVLVPAGYEEVNGVYLSPGFVEEGHIEIETSLVLGTITLREE